MTFFYRTHSWSSQPQATEETIELWKKLSEKANWRIVQLANGFYQTEYQDIEDIDGKLKWVDVTRRETIEGAEKAIDSSVEHFTKKVAFLDGPKVVKTFE
jgi:hypothetical protein